MPAGAFLSIFGPNGAGKTTLLRVLSTLARLSAGEARRRLRPREEPDKVRERIGLISHQSMLYPDLTAEENLLLYAELYGVAVASLGKRLLAGGLFRGSGLRSRLK